ncbi:Lon protease C-terminal proteolytic domain-containing protein [Lipomyces arxii]|uniref:Lon protease C-terminal proteolytic domain-containing protein n=1 Tax=Lipomyces arxii TaxID=56418 RepID=UPI0034CFBBD0
MIKSLPKTVMLASARPAFRLSPAARILSNRLRPRSVTPIAFSPSVRAFSQTALLRESKKSDDGDDKDGKDSPAKKETEDLSEDKPESAESTTTSTTDKKSASKSKSDDKHVDAKESAKDGTTKSDESTPTRASRSRDSESGKAAKESRLSAAASDSSKKSGSDSNSGTQTNSKVLNAVPDEIPELMALPIVARPLFPGFYKAVVIHDARHIEAIKELVKRGQPYIGVFLNKEASPKSEAIMAQDEIYHNGVLAQITSVFPQSDIKDPNQKEGLTIVLYPHRRIQIESVEIAEVGNAEPIAAKEESATEAEVTSFDIVPEGETAQDSPMAFLRNKVTMVHVVNRPDDTFNKTDPTISAVVSEIVTLLKEISTMNPLFRDQITAFTLSLSSGNVYEEPVRLSDFAAAVSAGESSELQDLIDTRDVGERLQKGLVLLKKELMNAKLQSKINKDVENKIQKRQREYYLMEQMRGIRRELGLETDGKDKLVEKFKERAEKLELPEVAQRVFDEELSKLMNLEPAASEFNVTRNYLDWITQLPWGRQSSENYSIKHAMTVLDDDHYGLKDVKDRILEFIAVGKLRGNVDGKILCFVGPPGVGKTSIGKSIARALNRQFQRFSVGGLSDVAEIKGHRRTYVGALPGRIIQSLKKCQTENPLILIDEVDKIGHGHQGDPASALLELLDPEQNHSFMDHYMDIPVDLSKVLFVCTANMTDTIPRPLLDRMEVIRVSGYIAEEKKAIAMKYLAPQAREQSGLKDADVELTPEAVDLLINSYCAESGVRNLKQQIDKVYRKAALDIVKDAKDDEEVVKPAPIEVSALTGEKEEKAPESMKPYAVPESVHVHITPDNVSNYVGPPVYVHDKLYESEPPVGVVTGLAWTAMGGDVFMIESVLESPLQTSSTASFKRTGMLGDVLKESTVIAYTFAKMYVATQYPENRFFDHARIHLHCPEGATPKDGPSAGVTISTSLLSLALNRPIDAAIAMTGEITVTGRIRRIGGLREKFVAARRDGAKTVLFPKANMADYEALPDNLKEGIQGVPCTYFDDVFNQCFKGLSREEGNKVWANTLKSEDTKSGPGGPGNGLGDLFPPLGGGVNEIHA